MSNNYVHFETGGSCTNQNGGPNLTAAGTLTIEARVKFYIDSGGQTGAVFACSNQVLQINPSGNVVFMLWSGGGVPNFLTSTGNVNDGNEHLITGTFNGSATSSVMNLYIDGVFDSTLTGAFSYMVNCQYIGGYHYIGNNIKADIRDCRMWNIVRTPAQILSAYSTGVVGTETGLVVYQPCNEGSGVTVHDITGGYYSTLDGTANTGWVVGNPYVPPTNTYVDSSNAIFPVMAGLQWPVVRQPTFSTGVSVSKSLVERRQAFTQYAQYKFTLSFEYMYDDGTAAGDYQVLLGFFLARNGAFEDFLLDWADDNSVTNQAIGIGDGSTTSFQMCRTYAGVTEPIYGIKANPLFYVAGTLTTPASVSDHGVVTFTTAPMSGQAITATFGYYYRVRFNVDVADLEKFMNQYWEMKTLELVTVK